VISKEELTKLHGQPVWCHIPSDNPTWGIVDAHHECVVMGMHYRLDFRYYGEWKAFNKTDDIQVRKFITDAHKVIQMRQSQQIEALQKEVKRLQEVSILFNKVATKEGIKFLELRNEVESLQKENERYKEALEWIDQCSTDIRSITKASNALGESHDQ
jgi:hypothetical protein